MSGIASACVESSPRFQERLSRGAFLTVRDRTERVNTMTIGWASLGTIWSRPVLLVLVRPSRYTWELMERAEDFTVSLPPEGGLVRELELCGTRSGREADKFRAFGLKALPGRRTRSPVVGGCDLPYECGIVARQALDPAGLAGSLRWTCYPEGDVHTLYFGEILSVRGASAE